MEPIDVAVIGGGLAGWSAALSAARSGASVVVVDRDGTGGRASTDRIDGAELNRGAHAVYVSGPGTEALGRLGIEPRGATPPTRGALGRLGDVTHLLPVGPASLLRTRLLGTRDRVRLARLLNALPRLRADDFADVTIDELLDDQGLRPTAREVLAALVRLTSYVADHERVSADVAVTQLQLGTTGGVRYLRGGWGRLVEQIVASSTNAGVVRVRTSARQVRDDGDAVVVSLADGDPLVAERAVLAVGSPQGTASLVSATPESWTTLGPPAEAACLDVAVTGAPPPLVLGIDKPLYLNSHAVADLAPAGRSVAHVMRYLRQDDEHDPRGGRRHLEDHLRTGGVEPERVPTARYLHRMTVVSALPLAATGGMGGRPAVDDTGSPRLFVAGDWVGPTGHLADASLTSGVEAGRLAAELSTSPITA